MYRRHGADKKKSKWSCLQITFVIVIWCWLVLIYLYWRNMNVRAVVDEFYDAEKNMIQEDLKMVSDAIDTDIVPKLKLLERMKVVETLPTFEPPIPETEEERKVRSEKELSALKDRLAVPDMQPKTDPVNDVRHVRHGAPREVLLRKRAEGMIQSDPDEPEVHVVFSTDCNPFQDWQTLLVFHSGQTVGQKGHMTRIASGCPEKKKKELVALYKELYPNYYIHFTPDFKKDAKTKKKYEFYNKPYGVQHWLDHAEPKVGSGVIVAVIDPDFVFLRPLTAKVKGNNNNIVSGPVKESDIVDYVSKGHPVAQQYGLGAPWVYDNNKEFNRTRICGADSPCVKVPDHRTGSKYWSVGPPYLLERDDLHRLTQTWTKFVPRVYENYPQLLAEMFAYSMAGAHEELPHLRMDNYMVSNVAMSGGEGWKWVDKLPDVCKPPVNGIYFPDKPLPNFLHYCQFFRSREIGFQKRRVKKDIFSCEQDLLLEPPSDLGFATYMIRNGNREEMNEEARKRNGFALCVLHRSINAAATDYKERMCKGNPKTSYNKTLNVIMNEKW